ncbi:MAG: peptidoglycan DD-metalloendopeptidase family protein [Chloroflexi bacterium]|nr:peptidoglycan DD-metalloendopeptidase family protein [Chloroflexota bacterium]
MTETPDGVPISDGFDFPVGKPDSQGYYVAAWLVDPDYKTRFGVWHPGEDWNGTGGGDTDLGAPVYAISNGRVAFADYNPKSWGNIVLLEHALPDGVRVWSQYAHLQQLMVTAGQKVPRGQQLGTIGKGANDVYPAHLHFEIRRNDLSPGNWKPIVDSRDQVLANYYYPSEFIKAHRPGSLAQPAAKVQQVQVQPAQAQSVQAPPTPQIQVVVDSQRTNPAMGRFRRARTDNWYSAPSGAFSSTIWTIVSATQERNWGEWQPFLPAAGRWEVSAFVPDQQPATSNARYRITHADGQADVPVNQSKFHHAWVSLGAYRFEPGRGSVRLSDLTGESGQNIKIAFDAMRWVKVG